MTDNDDRTGKAPARPNLFIIGAPKCATSAMHSYLGEHPEIFMSLIKEPMHFCTDFVFPNRKRSDAGYFALFDEAGDAAYAGESSVFYMLSEAAAREIHAHNPDAKLIAMLRDPVDVIASHHSQIVYEGYETERDFERAPALEAERREAHAGRRLEVREKVLHYRDIARYHEQLMRFLAHFPRSQLHVVFYEDLVRDLPAVYRGILEFLGVDPEFRPTFPVVNKRKEIRSRKVADFLNNTPDWLTSVWKKLLPDPKLRSRLKWKLRHANTRKVAPMKVPDSVRAMLIEELREDIVNLSRLLDRDLDAWLSTGRNNP
ncbi:MAG: sulfotransferase [Rhodothalassiaceae bacterium]